MKKIHIIALALAVLVVVGSVLYLLSQDESQTPTEQEQIVQQEEQQPPSEEEVTTPVIEEPTVSKQEEQPLSDESEIISKLSKNCQLVINEKKLSDILSCDEEEYTLEDGAKVSYVSVLTSESKEDCAFSECYFGGYVGTLDEQGLRDFNSPLNLFHLILDEYGEQCARFEYYDSSDSFRRYILHKEGSYYWAYDFSQFFVEKNLGEYTTYYKETLQSYPTTCVLDGTLIVTGASSGYASEADFSMFMVEFRNR